MVALRRATQKEIRREIEADMPNETPEPRLGGLNVHIYPSNLKNESRIMKITRTLEMNGVFDQIEVLGVHERQLPKLETVHQAVKLRRISPLFRDLRGRAVRIIKILTWYVASLLYLVRRKPACINAHSLPVLPLSVMVKWLTRARLIYDTHELETEVAGSRGAIRGLLKFVERVLIRHCDAVCTVNQEIARWYGDAYGIETVWVVENAPVTEHLEVLPERSGLLRDAFSISDDEIVFIYQGLLSHGRGIDLLLDAFSRLPHDRHIVFMGYGQLEDRIARFAHDHENIHVHPAVPPAEILRYTRDADVGVSLIENVCLSYYYCLPNKLFEYLAAGIPVIASDFPTMSRVITEFDCGWMIEPTDDSIAELVKELDLDAIALKANGASKSRGSFGWHFQEPSLLAMYRSLQCAGSTSGR